MSDQRGIDRRTFAKTAVAIGGSAALSACLGRFGGVDVEQGPDDLSSIPDRQHDWNAVLATDEHGNNLQPRHHVLLLFEYAADGTPSERDRETVETAFQTLERAYVRGNEGLLFTVGYTPRYFDRFDASLPDAVDLPDPEALAPFEDPALDTPDALVHLASDHAEVVLAAEEALRGEREEVNGVSMETSVDGVLSRVDRRTGFIGEGLPAENDDVAGVPEGEVPEESPLFMGFKSGFEKNQATEDRVTIQDGPFAGGTTQHLSKITLSLDQWYNQDSRRHRVSTMFCPAHAEDGVVEGVGDNLGTDPEIESRGCPAHTQEDARTEGVVGHSQKTARAREDGRPIILRRDFDSTDDDQASVHFLSLQRAIGDFVETRKQMNGTDVAGSAAVGQRTNNGILQYMTVTRRGNYFLPPRAHRSLPTPDPR